MSNRLTKPELEAVCEAIAFRRCGDPEAYEQDNEGMDFTLEDLKRAHEKLSERL